MKFHRFLSFSIMAVLALSLLSGCSSLNQKASSGSFFAMDTFMSLTVYGDEALISNAEALVLNLESKLSVTDTSSEIYKLNKEKEATVSPEVTELLLNTLDICSETDGALDITVYPLVTAWGFTTGKNQVPSAETIEALIPFVDFRLVTVNEASDTVIIPGEVSIDLGAVSKGYTGDSIIAYLKSQGVTHALLNLGGNVQVIGTKPDNSLWKIAISDPIDTGSAIGYVSVADAAVITSGSYQRYFEQDGKRYHHIIDPSTGYPADNSLASVTIVGSSGLMCDGLSTALFVMGIDRGIEYWRAHNDFEVIWVDSNDNIYITEGLSSVFTKAEGYSVTEIKR